MTVSEHLQRVEKDAALRDAAVKSPTDRPMIVRGVGLMTATLFV